MPGRAYSSWTGPRLSSQGHSPLKPSTLLRICWQRLNKWVGKDAVRTGTWGLWPLWAVHRVGLGQCFQETQSQQLLKFLRINVRGGLSPKNSAQLSWREAIVWTEHWRLPGLLQLVTGLLGSFCLWWQAEMLGRVEQEAGVRKTGSLLRPGWRPSRGASRMSTTPWSGRWELPAGGRIEADGGATGLDEATGPDLLFCAGTP